MRDDHVSIRTRGLIEVGTLFNSERLRNVDLNVVDEVAIPDWLEESVGKSEREDVLSRLLAEEVINPEDLLLGEDFMELRIQCNRRFEVHSERLLHDDPRTFNQPRLCQEVHR